MIRRWFAERYNLRQIYRDDDRFAVQGRMTFPEASTSVDSRQRSNRQLNPRPAWWTMGERSLIAVGITWAATASWKSPTLAWMATHKNCITWNPRPSWWGARLQADWCAAGTVAASSPHGPQPTEECPLSSCDLLYLLEGGKPLWPPSLPGNLHRSHPWGLCASDSCLKRAITTFVLQETSHDKGEQVFSAKGIACAKSKAERTTECAPST